MTGARQLWLGVVVGFAVAVAVLVLAQPADSPGPPAPVALSAGALAGLALFVAVERRLPPQPRPELLGVRVWVAKHAVLAGWAGVEEIVWRGLVLAELARIVGVPAALAAASIGFGVWHRSGRRYHVITGLAFGTVFLAAGLAAAWSAHAAYNGAVAVTAEARRVRAVGGS